MLRQAAQRRIVIEAEAADSARTGPGEWLLGALQIRLWAELTRLDRRGRWRRPLTASFSCQTCHCCAQIPHRTCCLHRVEPHC